MGNHPATFESVQRQSPASTAQHPMQLPRASRGVVQWDEVSSEVGSKWHRAETMGRALPEPGELREGHLGFLQAGQEGMEGQQELDTVGRHQAEQQSGDQEVRST